METKNLKIKFKVTASKKFKCNKCRKYLYGEDGFIDIQYLNLYRDEQHRRICWNCFVKSSKEFDESRENREERFLELVKKNIVRHL